MPSAPPIPKNISLQKSKTHQALYAQEFSSILNVVARYLSRPPLDKIAPFDVPWLIKLHHEMFADTWQWGGKLRQSTSIYGFSCQPDKINDKLTQILKDLHTLKSENMAFINQATSLHHRIVQVHPFEKGNGKWARLLINIWLKQHAHPLVLWPSDKQASVVFKKEYIKALQAADARNLRPFIALHKSLLAVK